MKKVDEKCSGIILAGGRSKRFGRDKTILKIEGKLLIERQTDLLKPMVNEIIIVSNSDSKFGLFGTIEVYDSFKNSGPIGGLHAGLSYASNEKCIVLACDMPFICHDFVKNLLHTAIQEKGYEMIIPISKKGIEPLCGIYSRGCIHWLEQSIKKGERKLIALIEEKYKEGYVKYVKVKNHEQRNFYNINREEDYKNIALDMKKDG